MTNVPSPSDPGLPADAAAEGAGLLDPGQLAAAGLRLQVDHATARITLNRPERRNAMTPRMWAGLADIAAALPAEVRVVVLRGAGSCFSAGLDRAMLDVEGPDAEPGFAEVLRGNDEQVAEAIAEYQEGFVWLHRPDLITVAAVHGYAIGGGFQLALACDLRVVADDALFCMKEPALGLVPDLAGTRPLVEAVGYSRALEICATARFVGADEATAIGLATLAVPADQLEDAVDDLVAAVLDNPVDAVRDTKALLQAAPERSLEEQRRAERLAQVPHLRRLAGATRRHGG